MKEIKFRAYDRIEERIYYDVIPFGEFVVLKYSQAGYEMLDIEIEDYDLIYSEDFSDYEIMQYTGLKDKNGVEIYEGDIVRWTRLSISFDLETYETRTDDLEVGWCKYNASFLAQDGTSLYKEDSSQYEVVGNIYENPELLKEQNK